MNKLEMLLITLRERITENEFISHLREPVRLGRLAFYFCNVIITEMDAL